MINEQRAWAGGFSLIELMIVVAIIAILVAVGMPAYFNYMMRSRQTAAIGELMSIKAAEERFFAENSGYAGRLNRTGFMYSTNATYRNGDYRYWVTADTNSLIATGTIHAEGDLNGDGNFTDVWEVSIDNLSDKPKQVENSSHEGFSWKTSLANLFK